MTALAIILAILLVIALLRFGVSVEYSGDGFTASARIGFLTLRLYPRKPKKEKRTEARKTRKKKEKKAKEEPEEKKPGGLKPLLDMIPAVKKLLHRLRRRLCINRLTILYTAAGEDPASTAMAFGASNAAIATVFPVIARSFRIRRRDIRTYADFDLKEPVIYINAAISLAVWEALYIITAVVPALLRYAGKAKSRTGRKDEKENGETPDK